MKIKVVVNVEKNTIDISANGVEQWWENVPFEKITLQDIINTVEEERSENV